MAVTIDPAQFQDLLDALASPNPWISGGLSASGAIAALFIAYRGWSKHDTEGKAHQDSEKKLLFRLLEKEIDTRWPEIMRMFNEKVLNIEDDYEFVDRFAHRRISGDDLFVIASVSKGYHNFTFIDSNFIFEILLSYQLLIDIVDSRDNADHVIHDLEQKMYERAAHANTNIEQARDSIKKEFSTLLQRRRMSAVNSIEALDVQLKVVKAELEKIR